jgi:pectate disaccharide-lyase
MSAVVTGASRVTKNSCLHSQLDELTGGRARDFWIRRMSRCCAVFLLFLSASVKATIYYVATNGNDSASGTSTNTPFLTPERAIRTVNASDTLYVRGGTFVLTGLVKTAKAGLATNYCKLWAYPGEHPIFNGSNAPSGFRALDIRSAYWHVKNLEIDGARDNGIIVASGTNIVEACVIHDCNNDGITLGSSSSPAHGNLILNCDSYRNYQVGSGGNNGDGFSAKSGAGPGNVFRGCRAWFNSDDGWDFYANDNGNVTLENCWSFHNGTNLWNVGSFSGNGNGFKLGGAGTLARHVLKQCLAFKNHSKGFDHNHSLGGHTLYNCTGFNNANPNFSFYEAPTNGTNVFKNNVSFPNDSTNIIAGSIMVSNSWQNGLTVSVADFISLDDSLAFAPRNDDYSLPTNGLARLAAGSDLIDAGVDVGLPYNGSAPDLGAFEFVASPRNIWLSDLQWSGATGFSFNVNGLTSHGQVIIYASPDLANWSGIFTNPPVTGSLPFVDPTATDQPQQFYKAQEQ